MHDVVRIDDHKDIPGGVSRLRCLPEGVFAGCIHFMDIVALLIQHIAAGQEFFLGADEKQQIVILVGVEDTGRKTVRVHGAFVPGFIVKIVFKFLGKELSSMAGVEFVLGIADSLEGELRYLILGQIPGIHIRENVLAAGVDLDFTLCFRFTFCLALRFRLRFLPDCRCQLVLGEGKEVHIGEIFEFSVGHMFLCLRFSRGFCRGFCCRGLGHWLGWSFCRRRFGFRRFCSLRLLRLLLRSLPGRLLPRHISALQPFFHDLVIKILLIQLVPAFGFFLLFQEGQVLFLNVI